MHFTTKNTLIEALGITLELLDKNKVVASMPVDHRTKQIVGVLHGGASAALLETVASIGSCLNIDMNSQNALGTELNISHLRAVADGSITAVATPARLGKTLHVWDVSIHVTGNPGMLVSKGRCSVYVKNK